ncbi:MAG TPA: hypothetical protein VMV69_25800 [Pirellulales bacterium]|nr:hypothetical protein [Pirellulales bacterium]
MIPSAFLNLAIHLSNDPGADESWFRTAVGRAYYAAFHVGLEFAERLGVRLPRQEHVHKKLMMLLGNCRLTSLSDAGKLLDDLKRDRNHADYSLRDPRFGGRNVALAAIARSQRLCQIIDDCGADPDTAGIKSAIQDSARLLGLSVV